MADTSPDALHRRLVTLETSLRAQFPELLPAEVRQTATDDERDKSLRHTVVTFGPLWTVQGLVNMVEHARRPMVDALKDRFAGKPAIIVGPGPSLEKNLHLLPQLKGHALIICYSRTLGALQRIGVAPDIVVVLDPLPLSYHFAGYPIEDVEALVVGITCAPQTWRIPFRHIFGYSGNSVIEDWIHKDPFGVDIGLETSSSVATTTYSLARHVGADPIIYIGQDMAFPPDAAGNRRMYHKDTGDGGAILTDEVDVNGQYLVKGLSKVTQSVNDAGMAKLATVSADQVVDVLNWDRSGKVRATPSFGWVREWLERRMAEANGSPRFINATEGGAHIAGMEHIPLAEAIEQLQPLQPLDVRGILDDAADSVNYARKRIVLTEHLRKHRRILRRSAMLLKRLKRMKGKPPTPRNMTRRHRLICALAMVTHESPLFCSMPVQGKIQDDADKLLEAKKLADVWAMGDDFADAIDAMVGTCLPWVDQALDKMDRWDDRYSLLGGVDGVTWYGAELHDWGKV